MKTKENRKIRELENENIALFQGEGNELREKAKGKLLLKFKKKNKRDYNKKKHPINTRWTT